MINRRLETVEIVSFVNSADRYGQKRKEEEERKSGLMYITVYSQTNVADPRFIDAEYVGLTNLVLDPTQQIIWQGRKFNILNFVPTGRFNRVLLKEVG